MKDYYEVDKDFSNAWKAFKDRLSVDKTPYLDYFIQYRYLFKGHQICITIGLVRENLIRELNSAGLGGHFLIDKTKAFLIENY